MAIWLVMYGAILCGAVCAVLFGTAQRRAAKNWQQCAEAAEKRKQEMQETAESFYHVAEKRTAERDKLQTAYDQLDDEHRNLNLTHEADSIRTKNEIAALRDALRESENERVNTTNMLRAANDVATERSGIIKKLQEQQVQADALKAPPQPTSFDVLRMDLKNLFAYNGSGQGQKVTENEVQ